MNEKQKEAESKAGIGQQRRGQQMGDDRSAITATNNQMTGGVQTDTPAMSGNRAEANEYFADNSTQQIGGDPTTPGAVSPSTPAAIPSDTPFGQSGGERAFNAQSPSANQKKN